MIAETSKKKNSDNKHNVCMGDIETKREFNCPYSAII
jgi:hypothetical protein